MTRGSYGAARTSIGTGPWVPGQDPYDEQFLLMATTGILDSRAWSDDHNPKNPPLQHPFAWGYARRRADLAILVIPFPTKAAADAWFASIAHTVKQRIYDVVAVYSESDLLAYREFAQPLVGYWPEGPNYRPPMHPPTRPPPLQIYPPVPLPVPMTPGGIPPRNVLVDAPGTAPQVRGSYYGPYYPGDGWTFIGAPVDDPYGVPPVEFRGGPPPAIDALRSIAAGMARKVYAATGNPNIGYRETPWGPETIVFGAFDGLRRWKIIQSHDTSVTYAATFNMLSSPTHPTSELQR